MLFSFTLPQPWFPSPAPSLLFRPSCVTFVQVVKSKMFMAALDKTAKNGRLSRVVIDEAHCCSQVSDRSKHAAPM